MSLRTIARSVEEQNSLNRRFTSQPVTLSLDEISAREAVQEELNSKIAALAHAIDIDLEDSREKSLALTALEDVQHRVGRAVWA